MEIKSNDDVQGNQLRTITEVRSSGQGDRDFADFLRRRIEREDEDEQEQAESTGAGIAYLPIREVISGGELEEVRAILPEKDLDQIVVTVRTQLLPGGQREVTLDLPHSVLEGLRAKLNLTASGRLTIDFIASSEQVKTQLDLRAHELSDRLRARGIDVAALKTSLSDSSGRQGDPRDARDRKRSPRPKGKVKFEM